MIDHHSYHFNYSPHFSTQNENFKLALPIILYHTRNLQILTTLLTKLSIHQ